MPSHTTRKRTPSKSKKHPKNFEEARLLAKNTQMAFYILSAIKLGVDYEVIIPGLFVKFRKDDKTWRIHKALTPLNDSVAMYLASYKNTCNTFLAQKGLPVPKQLRVNDAGEILDFMKNENVTEIVVKPTRGFGGAGVSIQPHTEPEIRHAFNFAYEKSLSSVHPKVLVEEFIYGKHYRLVVLGDKLIAASERRPPFVTGDGRSTVAELVETENKQLGKEGRPKIKIDDEARKALEVFSHSLDGIPKKGEVVTVRFNANMTSGGSTRECLAEVHPDYAKLAIEATKAIGLRLSGVDLITPDITDPKAKHAINEVNHDPGLRIHYMPDHGEPVDIATPIQQYILDNL
jgi:cyanophycin synthetase